MIPGPPRTKKYLLNSQHAEWLDLMNSVLGKIECKSKNQPEDKPMQTVFIVGAPRSGSTLLYQLLALSGAFGFIDNIAARFWNAPELGIHLSQSIFEKKSSTRFNLVSDHGKTHDPGAPHEFGHFWQRWFDFNETHALEKTQLDSIDRDAFTREIRGLAAIHDKPFLFKNLTLSFQIEWLASVLPESRFILMTREPEFQCQSIYQARIDIHGSETVWWSIRPAAYPELKTLDIPRQICGQVSHTLNAVNDAFLTIDKHCHFQLKYESLCESPLRALESIAAWLGLEKTLTPLDKSLLNTISCRNQSSKGPGLLKIFKNAWKNIDAA